MQATRPFTAVSAGVRVRVKLTPKASSNRIGGVEFMSDGAAVLKVAVTAAPEGGKANARLISLLAKSWKLPKTRLRLVTGARNRLKTLHVEGDSKALLKHLRGWMESNHG